MVQHSYRELVIQRGLATIKAYPILVLMLYLSAILIDYFFDKGIGFVEITRRFLEPTYFGRIKVRLPSYVWFGVACFVSVFINSAVWYFQERNPRYIAKMERAEREKQEKESAIKAQKKNLPVDE